MEYLIVVFILLALVTVVGHGIWIGIARLFGGSPRKPSASRCPRCGLGLSGNRCAACAWPGPQKTNASEAFAQLAAQVARLEDLAIIDSKTRTAFDAVLDAQRKDRATAQAPARPAAAPPETPPVVVEPVITATLAAPASPSSARPDPLAPSPAERAAAFVARQRAADEVKALATSAGAPQASAPHVAPPPRASWADWLGGFMEERNIRWGELVGGLLIVCSSIALVISFWSAIEARPWLKFLLFNGVTAATFGAGFYCERRLRLPTTAEGLLTIGALLVPLNFLAIAALSSAPDARNLVILGAEAVSAVLFAALVYFAARVLVRRDAPLFTLGVMTPALANLLVRRFIHPEVGLQTLAAVTALPTASYLLSNLRHARRLERGDAPKERDANALFKFLGITTFATALPLALLAYKTGHPILALRQLPLVAALMGLVPLSAGLVLWQRLTDRQLSGLRTAGTAVAILGAAVSLTGLAVGWPEPSALLPAALAEFAMLSYLGWRYGLPALHLPAAACLAIVCLLGVYLWEGRIVWTGVSSERMVDTLISGESGVLLAPLVALYAGLAGRFRRRTADASTPLGAATLMLMAASVALLGWFGYGNAGVPLGAGWIYLAYAAGLLAWSARSAWRLPAAAGLGLLLFAIWQLVVFRVGLTFNWTRPWFDALLIFASLSCLLGLIARRSAVAIEASRLRSFAPYAALAASVVAATGAMLPLPLLIGWLAWRLVWLAVVWSVLALALDWRPLGTLAQTAVAAAAVFAVASVLQHEAWFQNAPQPWLDPRLLQGAGLALVVVNLLWVILRALAWRYEDVAGELVARGAQMLRSPWLAIDRGTTGGLVALVAFLATTAVLPGVLLEIAPPGTTPRLADDLRAGGFDYSLAGLLGTWLLAAALIALLLVTLRQSGKRGWLYGAMLTLATAAPLAATRFADVGAVASALGWASTLLLLIASAGIWCRGPIAQFATTLGFRIWKDDARAWRDALTLVLLTGLLAPVMIAAVICVQALDRSGMSPHELPYYVVPAIAMTVLAAILWAVESRAAEAAGGGRRNLPLATPALALVLGVTPLVGMLLYQVAMALAASPIRGPDAASLFARLGSPLTYGVPVAIVALTLLGYAMRERSGRFALAAGVVTCLIVCVMWLLANSTLLAETSTWFRLAQLTASTAALFTLCWIWLVAWDRHSEGRYGFLVGGTPFDVQSMIAPAISSLVVGWTWWRLFSRPAPPFGAIVPPEFVDVFGLVSLGLVILAAWLATVALARPLSRLAVSALLVTAITVAAGIATRWDTGNMLALRTLYLGHLAAAGALLFFAWRERRAAGASWIPGQFWPALQTAVVVGLAARMFDDHPWWSIGGWTLAAVVFTPAMAILYQRRRYLYAAAILTNIAGLATADRCGLIPDLREFLYWNILLAAFPVPAWLAIELRVIRPRWAQGVFNFLPAHRVIAWLAAAWLTTTVAGELMADVVGGSASVVAGVNWIALAATSIATASLLWDVRAREAIGMLYLLGLAACGALLDVFNLTSPWLMWTGGMVLAAYTVATSTLWTFRTGLARQAAWLGVPTRDRQTRLDLTWLVPANLLLVASVIVLALGVLLTSARVDLRVLIAQATLAQVASLALLARGERRDVLQHAALSVGAIGAVYFGWAWLVPEESFTLLHALIVVAAATVTVAAFYGLGLVKLLGVESPWLSAARRMMPPLVAIGMAAILASLSSELVQFITTDQVQIAMFAVIALGATIVALTLAALAAAILPGRDPLSLNARGRTAYVYAAEVLLALLFVHIRISFPWLFSGYWQQYWPLIVIAIAFIGVGCGELFRRRQIHVLASPLENTGTLLPVLPVLGYWFVESKVDYSLLLVGVGLLYAGLSIARRSFGFGVLAALAANGGLWFFLGQQQGWGFLAHPQVWLIPPAVCVLVAAYLNRRQLTDAQMTAIRYASSMAVYLSSTADIFLNGVAQAPWLPVVLAGLSVLGILAGILLRVRAFLLLGTGFLALALFTVIWHAAVDLEQTWIWFACLGVLGLLILVLFAFFEKRRQDVLEVVERLKQWEA